MLHNLQRRVGPDTPIQLLDHLRALRTARADRLRFLFTGSIGLHLVLRSLRDAGNTNDPVNDMLSLTVPPMADRDTCQLAKALLRETRATTSQIPRLAREVTKQVGGFPYYVHHVVDQLDQLRRQPKLQDVSAAVDHLVYDPHDPANLNYYLTCLSSYYAENQRILALVVLDTLAGQPSPISVPGLLNLCRTPSPVVSARATPRHTDCPVRGPLHRAHGVCQRNGVRLPLAPHQEMVEGDKAMKQGILRSSRYSPGNMDRESLEAVFVGRDDVMEDVLSRVAASIRDSQKHYILLVGPRGSGKTHLLRPRLSPVDGVVRRRRPP